MKALVTGANGQLGRALAATVPPGWTCVALDRAGLDLADAPSIRAVVEVHRPDLILNAAAYTAVDRAESEEALATAINGTAVGLLREAADALGAHLVHISTDFVFDGSSSRAYAPGDPLAPLGAYGRSKAAGEALAGPGATIIRTSWVHAAGGANFARTMLRLMRERDEVRVVADQIGAPTWASGLARVAWALGERRAGGVFHHSDAGVASWYDFALAVQEEALALGLLSREVPVVPIATADYPTPAARPAFSLLDSSATRALLGWPAVHWRVQLRSMLKEELALG
ncbi:MAG TPA: dTDP-4-dehydrorhamnose reductase [Novosphingobium sp.]|nr:dTDP-4-dehydrorhamnose reductase [Novosphingobium sp.]